MEVQQNPEKALAVIPYVVEERRTPANLLHMHSRLTHQQLQLETLRAFSHRCQATDLALVKRQEDVGGGGGGEGGGGGKGLLPRTLPKGPLCVQS